MRLWLLFFPAALFAFTESPWLTPIGEFELTSSYTLSHYPSIQGLGKAEKRDSTDSHLKFNLGVNFWEGWEGQVEQQECVGEGKE